MDAHGKPLFWVGSSLEDIRTLPDGVKRVVGFALRQAQDGRKHINAKPLKGFGGAGVLEIIEDDDGNTYRTVYTLKFTEAVYVLHAFQKKSPSGKETAKHDINIVRDRLKRAEEHYCEWQKNKG
jgi:phage-related protein